MTKRPTREEYAKLTPKEVRIKIAEYRGWTDIAEREIFLGNDEHTTSTITGSHRDYGDGFYELDDYLNDLNAMHEAVSKLTEEQREDLAWCLFDLTESNFGEPYSGDVTDLHWTTEATAKQRAEAFVLTMEGGAE